MARTSMSKAILNGPVHSSRRVEAQIVWLEGRVRRYEARSVHVDLLGAASSLEDDWWMLWRHTDVIKYFHDWLIDTLNCIQLQ